ncbi:hypothetical protein AAFF_G00330000 [Aldrovandia affinis]|uniref:Uncharacterized protein n=1 Tax=Aldrovandia affinis TaxID=143900 RepID=A0AAD7SM20_9TELE|nr:hypothetical protein AAFF_G00330000 [Aldrovandia affinis]
MVLRLHHLLQGPQRWESLGPCTANYARHQPMPGGPREEQEQAMQTLSTALSALSNPSVTVSPSIWPQSC